MYGSADPALTVTVPTGRWSPATASPASSCGRPARTSAATRSRKGSLTAGGNYDLTVTPGTLTITTKPITVTADDKTKVHRGCRPGADLQGHERLARARRQLQRSSYACDRRGDWPVHDHAGHADGRWELRSHLRRLDPHDYLRLGRVPPADQRHRAPDGLKRSSSLARRSRPSSCSGTQPVPSFGRRPTRSSPAPRTPVRATAPRPPTPPTWSRRTPE